MSTEPGTGQDDQSFVVNVFETSPFFPTTPMLILSVLKLLIDKAGDESGAGSYLSLAHLRQYFEAMGISEGGVDLGMKVLLEFRLVEPYDASNESVEAAQRVAIAYSGRIHFEMALRDSTYVSQMAFSTPLRSAEVVDRLVSIKAEKMAGQEWDAVRREFIQYCLDEDQRFSHLPSDPMYDGQRQLRRDLATRWVSDTRTVVGFDSKINLVSNEVPLLQTNWSHVRAVVKWFDDIRGFGFVDAGLASDVFVHVSTLRASEILHAGEGDVIVCDIVTNSDGRLQVIAAHSVEEAAGGLVQSRSSIKFEGEVEFFDSAKGFGFVRVVDLDSDIYVSASVLKNLGLDGLVPGSRVRGTATTGRGGQGYMASSIETITVEQ